MASNNPRSPRQKMINLMYLVFIAMLALNVSNEVLDGFDLVEKGLEQTIKSTQTQNDIIIQDLADINNQNPEKAKEWYQKADRFTQQSDELFNHIQDLKIRIVKSADGKNGYVENIDNKENIDAATTVMLETGNPSEGQKLRESINLYRELSVSLVGSETKKQSILNRLNTDVPEQGKRDNKNWEQTFFEKMPTSAAVTLLTKMQSDVKAAQGEVLADLFANIGGKDYRVNRLEANVIPKAEYVMAGGTYEGRVVLSAVDTTKKPTFSISGINKDGDFAIPAGAVGINKVFAGNLILSTPDGDRTYPFRNEYHVVPKMAVIQVANANVLYQGEENKMTISVPGMSNDQLNLVATNGSISKSGDAWVAVPAKAGENMKISVYSRKNNSLISEQEFRVRLLPDPTPYFEYPDANGNMKRFKSGGRIPKTTILNVPEIKASIDDGLIDRQFTVLRFSVVIYDVMGNRIPEVSNSGQFTEKQKTLIRQLGRGKTFLISDVKARGRDGVDRDIPSLEVRLN